LAMAINGEWGSGKTSLICTLKNKLDENQFTTIFFDAWKYEFSDPAAALFYTIAKSLGLNKRDRGEDVRSTLSIVLDIFATKYSGMSIHQMKDHFRKGISSVEILTDKLKNMIAQHDTGRIFVLIDDLDRCSLANVLEVLDSLKLFLSIENFIFVIAIDMNKIKLAWSYRYGNMAKSDEFSYLEKIFQIEMTIPQATQQQIRDYIFSLSPNMPPQFTDLVSLAKVKNPRSIKRLLNLILLRSAAAKEYSRGLEIAFLWTIVEKIIGQKRASELYNSLGGANGFYSFLTFANSFHFGRTETDEEKGSSLFEFRNRRAGSRYDKYLALLVGESRNEMAIFLIKSSRILQSLGDQKNITSALDKVVSFSMGM
jgi:hypothetical protein